MPSSELRAVSVAKQMGNARRPANLALNDLQEELLDIWGRHLLLVEEVVALQNPPSDCHDDTAAGSRDLARTGITARPASCIGRP